jgi:hypothetical protein
VIGRWLGGRGYWVAIGILSILLVLFGAAIVVNIVIPEVNRTAETGDLTQTPTPSPVANAVGPMRIPIPADADCTACHMANGGVMIKDIPVMAHPVEGWTDCTACHADDRLVKTAPGHTGIHKDECLLCHKPPGPGASALPRPHHIVAGTACITCHGSKAPLPTDMAGRNNCWICHPDASTAGLFASPAPGVAPLPSVPIAPGEDAND